MRNLLYTIFSLICFIVLVVVIVRFFAPYKSMGNESNDHEKVALTISTKTLTVSGPNIEPVNIVLIKDLKGKILAKTCFLNSKFPTSQEFCERVYKAIE